MKESHISYLWGKKAEEDEQRKAKDAQQERFNTIAYCIVTPVILFGLCYQAVSLLFE